jgi:hypothetical protein
MGLNYAVRVAKADRALANLEKWEAVTENTLRKRGYVPDGLAEQLISAQVEYAVAKDNLHEPYMGED